MSFRENLYKMIHNKFANSSDETLKENATLLMGAIQSNQFSNFSYNKYRRQRITGTTPGTPSEFYNQWLIYKNERTFDEGTPSEYTNTLMPLNENASSDFSKLKMHMDAVANQSLTGASSVRLYTSASAYTTLTSELLKSLFGDWMMYDFDNFSERPDQASKYSFIGAYDSNDNLVNNANCISLYYDGETPFLYPLIFTPQGNMSSNTAGKTNIIFGARTWSKYLDSSGDGVPLSDILTPLIYMYAASKSGVDPDSASQYTLGAGLIYRIANTSGTTLFYIVKKELVDEFMEDIMNITHYSFTYTGDVPQPTPPSSVIETAPGQPDNTPHTEGGTGDFSSDSIEDAQVGATGTAGYAGTCYVLNKGAMNDVKKELWDADYLTLIRDLFGSGQNTIINCLLFPFNVTSIISSSTVVSNIILGTHPCPLSTGSSAYAIGTGSNARITIGTLSNFKKVLGGFLDDSGVSECYIHLPFIGLKQIDPEIVYGHNFSVDYLFDFMTGECQALIYSNMLTEEDGQTFTQTPCLCYEFQGQAGVPIGFTESNINNNLMNVGINALKGAISGGKAAAASALVEGALSMVGSQQAHMEGATGSGIERMKSMDVYLLFIRPKTYIPKNYNKMKGRPSQQDLKLSDCKGFTVVDNPLIETSATDSEREMIVSLLKEGVRIK